MRKVIAQCLLAIAVGLAVATIYGAFTSDDNDGWALLLLFGAVVIISWFGLALYPYAPDEGEYMEKVLAKLEEVINLLKKGGR